VNARHGLLRRLARASAVALCLALAAPAFAAEPLGSAPKPTLKTTLSASAIAKVETLDLTEAVATTQAPSSADDATNSPAFFKTPKGAAVLVLLAAGVSYTIYSAFHDRKPVKSPIR
jgi:hypothetical protein